ncbi:kinase-like protein [Rhizodiscina lignyota]|uniref:ethanolamine kinase n=1 Tax=Rhizodiscina lignyota TaxID=1504668 RepID=A0A9P4I157_9PEZI|nr:kinase-like protein [Rhizodiscina lignyota]
MTNSFEEKLAPLRRIHKQYDTEKGDESVLELVLALYPEWEKTKEHIRFLRFTDGITNNLYKAENRRPGLSQHQINEDAVLLRAYGHGTHLLIDRERECLSHSLCAENNLAPPLLARFDNGLMYKFIEGNVTSPADMRRPEVSRGIARKLGEWHAKIPTSLITDGAKDDYAHITPGKPVPNLWTVISRWIAALPSDTGVEIGRKAMLAGELPWIVKHLGNVHGVGSSDPSGFVFSHCDLLSGNVIMHESQANGDHASSNNGNPREMDVSFIDYEYATPAPAAFDIANHFAEWGGFDCDFSVLPTQRQRRDFLEAYLHSYHSFHQSQSGANGNSKRICDELDYLMAEVDAFRGMPGFYWGVWALIQATISQIDFDYASYAQVRLGEYWAWKKTVGGDCGHLHDGKEVKQAEQVREKRWRQES